MLILSIEAAWTN